MSEQGYGDFEFERRFVVQDVPAGLLETTPEQHPVGQPIYRVEVLPPGSKLPPGGVSPVVLGYRNDDGGPSFQKDARVTFDPPEDGRYLIRVVDARGLGGEEFGYHLVVRRPRPDFQVFLGTENPNVPRGGTSFVGVNIARLGESLLEEA